MNIEIANNAKEEKLIRRSYHGYGGKSCVCCNGWGTHPRKSNAKERRKFRRIQKQNLKNLI